MILITILLVFFTGYAFCAWIVPFLDNLFNTIAIGFSRIQGKMAVKITEDSVTVTKLKRELNSKEEDEAPARVLGFVIPEENEDEEYEDDE